MSVHLLDEHAGRHCAPARPRRTLAGRVRSWFRPARPVTTLLDPPNVPAREVAGDAARRTPDRLETGPATGGAPGLARPGAVRPPGSHPYPLPGERIVFGTMPRHRPDGRPPWPTAGLPVYVPEYIPGDGARWA